ncbi:ATP-dependent RNA helicase HrpA [Phycisphaerales bacterium]|nr:ATP-dependent RNA helicase HrpA [Phycisphaerales bacterium]
MKAAIEHLLRDIESCGPRDARRLRGRFHALTRAGAQNPEPSREFANLAEDVARARRNVEQRRARVPAIVFPEDLPVSARRSDIAQAVREHQVVVVCGETGSGKTTQLPKLCLELGRGAGGMIGHTQPRRIAARSVATRIAEELGTRLGDLVGYKVRFGDHTGPGTMVKVMTDGVLLAETSGDRDLLGYDTIIIDEAHERSLNIDFLLGYLKTLLPRRPDLKVIITSATIDPQRFSRHFGDAPIVMVSGRTYPVEVLYRPPHEEGLDERDDEMQAQIVRAVDELASYGSGDILVFLSGEREIRETADTLHKHHVPGAAGTEVLPLFAKLSADEQMRVFRPHPGRRIVLATNVAETSLTVPGIRYVVDSGVARISRYAARTKVQRLEVEPVSRASADQRKGRCGRLGPGVCIRLYGEEDFASRSEFTDPEIVRTNLASVILQMISLRLGAVEEFPFLEPPDSRLIKDGYDTLLELGALDDRQQLTEIGRDLSRLPIDPRIGRMLLAARHEPGCCLADVLVIAAALSVQDPRDRPMEKQAEADAAHAAFRDERSDFLGYLRLWDWWRESRRHLSQSKQRKSCRDHFVSYVRMREWEDIHHQLAELVGSIVEAPGATLRATTKPPSRGRRTRTAPEPARDARAVPHHALTERPPLPVAAEEKPDKSIVQRIEAIHRALLSGLLSNIGIKGEAGEYAGARGMKFFIFPGSALFKAGPKWAMAAELVRTTKLYARGLAPVDPEWIERAGAHLVARSYFDPHWEPRSGRVLAFEKVTLFGLELVARRRVHFGAIDPSRAREVFIHAGLVEGGMLTRAEFFAHNMDLVVEVQRMEIRSRRNHILADPYRRFEFYAARMPPEIVTAHDFDRWHKALPEREKRRLFMTPEDVTEPGVVVPTKAEFPDAVELGRAKMPLEYRYEPGQPADGVTVRVPIEALTSLGVERFHWLVPGHLREKVETMLRGVPKEFRRLLPAAGPLAEAVVTRLKFGEGSLFEAIRAAVVDETKVAVPREAMERVSIPEHLQMRFEVLDEHGKTLAAGRDLAAIRAHLVALLKPGSGEVKHGAEKFNRDGLKQWDFDELPERIEIERYGTVFITYPALIDRGDSVSLRLFDRRENAEEAGRGGLRRLFMMDAEEEVRRATHRHPEVERVCVMAAALGNPQAFRRALVELAVDRALGSERGMPRNKTEFTARSREAVGRLGSSVREVCEAAEPILRAHRAVAARLDATHPTAWGDTIADVRGQLAALLPPDFLMRTTWPQLRHIPRYLAAVELRLQRLGGPGILKDRERLAEISPIWQGYHELVKRQRELGLEPRAIEEYRWLVEELRVSLFAQELRTAVPVSVKRLHEAWERVVKG